MWKVERSMWKVFCVTGVLLAALSAQAIDFVQTEQFISPENEILTDETWISAQTVTISGTVSNDLFTTAPVVELNGTFYGDVWSGGDSINAAGIFRNDVRLISRTTQVFGTLHGSLTAIGNTVKIDRTAILYSDLFCMGENVILEGAVSGNVRVIAQRATIGGKIDGDLSIAAQDIVILPGTILNGNLTYTAPKELVLSSTVLLNGTLDRKFNAEPARRLLKENLTAHFLFAIAALVVGLVFFKLFPRTAGASLYALQTSRGLCSLAGFSALFLLPMAAVFLLFTVIGLPLSILIFLFYFILLYLSKIVVALWIGSAILKKKLFSTRNITAPLALGLLILYALTSFPSISMVINILVIILGLGALLIGLFKKPVLILQTPNAINATNKEG